MCELQRQWSERGEPCWHDSYGWAYVDDMIFNFVDWAQCERCVGDLCQALGRLGLKLNLRKTALMSHPSVLRAGKSWDFVASSVIPQLTWSRSIRYLKKPLIHFDVDAHRDVTGLMVPAIYAAVNSSYEGLTRAVRKGRWHNPQGA